MTLPEYEPYSSSIETDIDREEEEERACAYADYIYHSKVDDEMIRRAENGSFAE